MKKNFFYFIAVAALSLISSSVFAGDIHLRTAGTRDQSGRPRTSNPSVSADLTEDDLTIDVNRYLGNASVVIMDETSAPVLTNSTHVYGQATVTMDVSTLSSGHYILTITLSDGATYEGEFEITE